jgi:hypothetical protein
MHAGKNTHIAREVKGPWVAAGGEQQAVAINSRSSCSLEAALFPESTYCASASSGVAGPEARETRRRVGRGATAAHQAAVLRRCRIATPCCDRTMWPCAGDTGIGRVCAAASDAGVLGVKSKSPGLSDGSCCAGNRSQSASAFFFFRQRTGSHACLRAQPPSATPVAVHNRHWVCFL